MSLFLTNVPALLLPIIVEETGFRFSHFGRLFFACFCIVVIVLAGIRAVKFLFSNFNRDMEDKK